MKHLAQKIITILASRRFFYVLVAFFVFEALWFVFSAVYPMAFDEEFHLGIIRLYAEQWSPILARQPDGPAQFGALLADPSYLYHYLMSFPYRLIALFTDNQAVQVVLLRLINVGIFVYALTLFRRVLLRAQVSRALTHTILALFILIPITPMLAAHINYDNLLILLVNALCLLAFSIIEGFKKREIRVRPILLWAVLAMVTSLVKYAALPIVLGMAIFLVFMLWRSFRGNRWHLMSAWRKDWARLSRYAKVGLVVAVVVVAGLFLQRYGTNLVRYHVPVPECDVVLSVERCKAYGPFARNHRMITENNGNFDRSPPHYANEWLDGMWNRLFFAVNGPASEYATRLPIPVPSKTAIVIGAASLSLLFAYWRQVFRGRVFLGLFMSMIVVYIAVLWLDGYLQYLKTGVPVAINGRYLLPILPFMAAIAGRAFNLALKGRSQIKAWLVVVVVLLFLHGGGVMTFIVRSDRSWYWQNNTVFTVNETARGLLTTLLYEGKKW